MLALLESVFIAIATGIVKLIIIGIALTYLINLLFKKLLCIFDDHS